MLPSPSAALSFALWVVWASAASAQGETGGDLTPPAGYEVTEEADSSEEVPPADGSSEDGVEGTQEIPDPTTEPAPTESAPNGAVPPPPVNYQVNPAPVGGATQTQAIGPHAQPMVTSPYQVAAVNAALANDPELNRLNAELEEAMQETSQYSLGWPIVLTAGGGATLVITLSTLLNISDTSGLDTLTSAESTALIVSGAVGAVALATGLIWLINRLNARAPSRERYQRAQERVQERQRELMSPAAPVY